ncbi:hypothetical protein BDR22DRAFT_891653 [Usnea florida]
MPSKVKVREFDPLLDRTGRPWRVDSKLAYGMPVGAFMWISHSSFVPESTRSPIQSDQRKKVWQVKHTSESEIAMIVDLYTLGAVRCALLPFRALEVACVADAIVQRREASLAAARASRWRQWFGVLDEAQQKAHAQSISETGNDTSWAGLWLECEERSKPGHTRLVATAVRAVALLDLKTARILMRVQEEALSLSKKRYEERNRKLEELGLADAKGPSSAPLTPQDIKTLNLRLAPCYFRLPAHAFRFATQVFSGKSYEEAVKEQKANFNSWVKEANVCRVIDQPDLVVSNDIVAPKDKFGKSTIRKRKKPRCRMQTGSKGTRPSDEDQLKDRDLMDNGTMEVTI